MTGEKNRYKTLEGLWKLDDDQLKTPRHDEMVLNLLTKESLFNQIPTVKRCFELIELNYQSDVQLDKTQLDNFENDENEKTLALCGYALRNIRLTLKEANQIPEWCPLEDSGA